MGLGGAAVVAERGEQGVERRGGGAGLIAAEPGDAGAVGLADEVAAEGGDRTIDRTIGPSLRTIGPSLYRFLCQAPVAAVAGPP